jgi:hypothetical protein
MPPVVFKLTISADERLQTYALDRTVSGTGIGCFGYGKYLRDFKM